MDLMSSLGIVCSVAIICFSSQEFAEYSFYYKSVIFLLSQQLLLCLKFLIQQSLPGNPQWVSELAARNEYIRYQCSLFGIYLLRSFSSFLFTHFSSLLFTLFSSFLFPFFLFFSLLFFSKASIFLILLYE